MSNNHQASPKFVFLGACIFPAILFIAWIGAWLLQRFVEKHWGWATSPVSQAIYWLVAKLLLWVWPAIFLIHFSGRKFGEVMGVGRIKQILLWGGGAGAFLLLMNCLGSMFVTRTPLWPSGWSWPLLGGIIISPLVEEIAFRGAIFPGLQNKLNFFWANTLTALLFLGMHLPGWYFQDKLLSMLKNPLGGALSIFLLGWLFGLVAHKSKSVSAGILTHIINNLSTLI